MKSTILFFLSLTFLFGACCTTKVSSDPNEHEAVRLESNTEELRLKLFLAEKYQPGNCYGMPSPEPFYFENSDKDTVFQIIKQLLPGKDDAAYMLLTQMIRGIKLTNRENNVYDFQFSDGQCCTIYHYKGIIEVKAGVIKERVFKKISETVPC